MNRNAPPGYDCPFCRMAKGDFGGPVLSVAEDFVWQDESVMAFIGSKQWPNNRGHALVVPVTHYENLYELPDALGAEIHRLSRRVALAMKAAYECDGISTRQHNEPAGNQDVWHYHLHIYPRWHDDDLYGTRGGIMLPEERSDYARQLRDALTTII